MVDLQKTLLNKADILSLNTPTGFAYFNDEIMLKIGKATGLLRSSYKIDKTKYDEVYVTSDIHADLLKLDNMLSNLGLVTKSAIEGSLESLYDKIPTMDWLPEKTLLIFVGDIVDGYRKDGTSTVYSIPDKVGNIELLLHAYIYNLRIKARAKHSEVLFTIGNHDYHTVIVENEVEKDAFYDNYVHPEANRFFGSRMGRRNCLLPFYNCCPYLMLDLGGEVAFIHGGFIGYDQDRKTLVNNTSAIREIQERLDYANNFVALTKADNEFLSLINDTQGTGYEFSPLWSRAYANFADAEVCPTISTFYKMVVVGHCQMPLDCGLQAEHTSHILTKKSYTKHRCGGLNGCVVIGCESDFGPQLAFVDIAFSRTFTRFLTKKQFTEKQEFDRRAELLLLKHTKDFDYSERYYNVIVRKNAGSGNLNQDEVMWVSLPTEVYKIINTLKEDIRDESLEFIRSADYDWQDEDTYEMFSDNLLDRYWKLIDANASIKAGYTNHETKRILKKYINTDLYMDTFSISGIKSPNPLHYVAIDANADSLTEILKFHSLPIEWYFQKLPVKTGNAAFYERYKKDNLIRYANMGFFEIINDKISKEKDPSIASRLFEMNNSLLIFFLNRAFNDKNEIMANLLGFLEPSMSTLLHYITIKGDERLFKKVLELNPPLTWLDRKLPPVSAKDFYAKFVNIYPIKFANKSARGILDIQILEETDLAKRAILESRKARLLQLSAKPKTARTAAALFSQTLAKPENAQHISNAWRKTLGVKKTGGRKRTIKAKIRRSS